MSAADWQQLTIILEPHEVPMIQVALMRMADQFAAGLDLESPLTPAEKKTMELCLQDLTETLAKFGLRHTGEAWVPRTTPTK